MRELNTAIFKFLWKGKPDLVSRSSIIQHPLFRGFSVVSIQFKVSSRLSQWVKRCFQCPGPWTTLMSLWFSSLFRFSPSEVFSCPFAFAPSHLPPFYKALLIAWRSLDGSFCASRSSLVNGASSSLEVTPLMEVSAKSSSLYLLSLNVSFPHSEFKFRPHFRNLYWSTTWHSLTFFPGSPCD